MIGSSEYRVNRNHGVLYEKPCKSGFSFERAIDEGENSRSPMKDPRRRQTLRYDMNAFCVQKRGKFRSFFGLTPVSTNELLFLTVDISEKSLF
ncbi:hypothetical protein WH47_12619 [Habropoda laboriosa]|uniref:Uncharacterized protein n=1 Tax=Habropoda laboriosa TaxID=597456 RepID=A0A0L7R7I9_9HYME|nr:hypothetical protein WH47_12619 [Habropoda laboriosa]